MIILHEDTCAYIRVSVCVSMHANLLAWQLVGELIINKEAMIEGHYSNQVYLTKIIFSNNSKGYNFGSKPSRNSDKLRLFWPKQLVFLTLNNMNN